MEFYLHTNLLILCFASVASTLQSKLNPNYRKNWLQDKLQYKGMLANLFDRFYVVTKFILPMLDDLKLLPIKYDKNVTIYII